MMQFRVGFMVAVSLLITGILVLMFVEPKSLVQGSYSVQVVFEQAPGILPGTPVRKSGIRIGRVSSVEFARDSAGRQDTRVLVTAAIDRDKQVYQDEICQLQTNLLGDAVLEFVRSPQRAANTKPIPEGAKIEGSYQLDPARMLTGMQDNLQASIVSVTQTSNELREVGKSLTVTLQNVNAILEENRTGFRTAVDQARVTLESIGRAADGAHALMGDPETQRIVKEQLRRLPQLVDDTQATIVGMKQTVGSLDRSLQNVERFTGTIGDERFIARFDNSIRHLEGTLEQLSVFSAAVNSPDGSLGKLVNDPSLYQHLNRAAQNVEELTRELRPIIDDARVFSDKVSRHPGVIVRDAIKPGAGIK
jgi:phospholipid/cholesterol/gamma-HCH transport system substrate-binding protein